MAIISSVTRYMYIPRHGETGLLLRLFVTKFGKSTKPKFPFFIACARLILTRSVNITETTS